MLDLPWLDFSSLFFLIILCLNENKSRYWLAKCFYKWQHQSVVRGEITAIQKGNFLQAGGSNDERN